MRYPDAEQVTPNHTLNRKFLDYCQRTLPADGPGRRADFGPEQMSAFLGNVMILEYSPDRADYRYRLYGTGLTRCSGFDLTNHWHGEFVGDVADVMRAHYDTCRTSGRLLYTMHEAVHKAQRGLWEQVLCPVVAASTTGDADQIVASSIAIFKT